jgi:hypothetical protein
MEMRRAAFITMLHILCLHGHCQRLSIDIMPGLMNYAGDLQSSPLTFNQSCFAFEAGLQYQLSDNFYLRGNYLAGQVKADDKLSDRVFARLRNLNFTSIILEGSISVEYDFFKLRVEKQWTPYIFAGVGYFFFNPYTYDTAGNKFYLQPYGTEGQGLPQYPDRKFYSLYQLNIPAGFGLKYALSDRVSIGFEVGFRKLFTDYLDDVSTTYPDPNLLFTARGPYAVELSFREGEVSQGAVVKVNGPRGNPGSKDDYYTGLFRFTYTLGGGGSGGVNSSASTGKNYLDCPKPKL